MRGHSEIRISGKDPVVIEVFGGCTVVSYRVRELSNVVQGLDLICIKLTRALV